MRKHAAITDHVERYEAFRRELGYKLRPNAWPLRSFARFAENRHESFVRSATVIEWASACAAVSQSARIVRLHEVHAFACWLHAEDERHEVPPRDALGYRSRRRPRPYLISVADIRKLLTAALAVPPAGTIAPLTWHYLFGLVAVTGLRIREGLALTFDDITADGLLIRDTKFGKSRMVTLHPSARDALNRYLAVRRKEKTRGRHLFVITTGGPPCYSRAQKVFQRILEQTGIREPGAARGPTLHSLRHSFAVRSLEKLDPGADPHRHMLALATYLGHANFAHTYWYLESTPVLMRGIAEAVEQAHVQGGSDD